jgi:ornithine carbamoyltransferase
MYGRFRAALILVICSGMHIRVATPEGYLPDKKVMDTVDKYCQVSWGPLPPNLQKKNTQH